MYHKYGAVVPDQKVFDERKENYLHRRNNFLKDKKASEDLKNWKAKNNEFNYSEQFQKGLVAAKLVGKVLPDGNPYEKADTYFSEYDIHNKPSLILSESPDSFVIGNSASYDGRQYPSWYNSSWGNGVDGNSPVGQGFGHSLVIPKKRIFNVVDPEATANGCAVLEEMKAHFIDFWERGDGKRKILNRTEQILAERNEMLLASHSAENDYGTIKSQIYIDFESYKAKFLTLEPKDLIFAFHIYPENSVGHLHMHVFPHNDSLRIHSTKRHDWKTVPIEVVLEAEKESPSQEALK